MRSVSPQVLTIAAAVPARLLARGATIADRDDLAERLRRRTSHVPRIAFVLTAPVWLVVIIRGVLYPAFGADDLEQSWGGPTLIGAWATHLVVAVAVLVAVSLIVALATSRSRRRPEGESELG